MRCTKIMLFLLFIHSLTTSVSPVAAADGETTPSSCKDLDNCRSLLNIVWSCLTTIFLCTWVAIHPNVPEPVDTTKMGFMRKCIHRISCFLQDKVPLFICALLVPEYILAWALRQHLLARKIVRDNENLKLKRTHGFFMIMGGFHYFTSSNNGEEKETSEDVAVHPLTWQNVISMLKEKKIKIPTEGEVQDKSKSDWFAKTVVLVQTLWFVTQCVARKIENLPTTELEIVTLAYTAINIGSFIAWLDKPRNVECPIRVFQEPSLPDSAIRRDWWETVGNTIVGYQDEEADLNICKKVPVFYSGEPGDTLVYSADGITLVAGVVFGAIHCIAWSFIFPSHTEAFLWRLSSVAITAVPVILPMVFFAAIWSDNDSIIAIVVVFMAICGALYIAARFTTLVLAFMNLSSLSPGALQVVHWTTLLPHV